MLRIREAKFIRVNPLAKKIADYGDNRTDALKFDVIVLLRTYVGTWNGAAPATFYHAPPTAKRIQINI